MPNKIDLPGCESCPSRHESIFRDLSDQALNALETGKGCRFYKKGQFIFLEGNHPHALFCLHKGKVKVFKTAENGREQIVRLAAPGDILGYRSLISGQPYRASAAALEDSLICSIPKDTIFQMIEKNTELAMRLMQYVCTELGAAEARMMSMAQKPVRERLAEVLLLLKEKFGLNEDGQTLDVELTREDLADIVGTATETVIRLLSELKNEGLVNLKGRRIQLVDTPGLIRVANLYD
ncbi:MAG: Crp/Fnr family transcriptional regulator [Calditrichaeota bacterium]|nr:MAG: Crp/Fnr family transcriptional regulator [Calditrichota bacterium]